MNKIFDGQGLSDSFGGEFRNAPSASAKAFFLKKLASVRSIALPSSKHMIEATPHEARYPCIFQSC